MKKRYSLAIPFTSAGFNTPAGINTPHRGFVRFVIENEHHGVEYSGLCRVSYESFDHLSPTITVSCGSGEGESTIVLDPTDRILSLQYAREVWASLVKNFHAVRLD